MIGLQSRIQTVLEYLNEKLDDSILQKVPGSIVGNPKIITFKSYTTSLTHLWNIARLSEYCKYLITLKEVKGKTLDVIEIGPGYGAAAYTLIKLGLVNSYTLVDLNENLINSVYFLTKNHPDWNVSFINSDSDINIVENCLNFISADRFTEIQSNKFDVAINTDSFGEMPVDTAKSYLNSLQNLVRENGLIISMNGHRRGQYSLIGLNRVSEYGYQNFTNVLFSYKSHFSSSMDDFGHLAICKNTSPNIKIDSTYLDVMGDLFAIGLNLDLNEIIDDVNSFGFRDIHKVKIELWDKILNEESVEHTELIGRYICFVRKVIDTKKIDHNEYKYLLTKIKSPQAQYICRLCRLIGTFDWSFSNSEELDQTMLFLMSDFERFKNKSKLKKYIFLEIRRKHLQKKFYPRRGFSLPFILKIRKAFESFKKIKLQHQL